MAAPSVQSVAFSVFTAVMAWVGYSVNQSNQTMAAVKVELENKSDKDFQHDKEIAELRARVTNVEINFAEFKARSLAK